MPLLKAMKQPVRPIPALEADQSKSISEDRLERTCSEQRLDLVDDSVQLDSFPRGQLNQSAAESYLDTIDQAKLEYHAYRGTSLH